MVLAGEEDVAFETLFQYSLCRVVLMVNQYLYH